MTNEQVLQLFREDELEIDGVTYTVEECGEFEQDDKYQSAELIFTDGNKFYRTYITRSGSPFSSWEYDTWGDADIDEVEKKSITVERWVRV